MRIHIAAFITFLLSYVYGGYIYAQTPDEKWRVDDASLLSRIEINSAPAVVAEILWRLPYHLQADTTNASIRVFSVKYDLEITNVYVREMDTERLTLAFEPLGSGEYEIYFSPHKQDTPPSTATWIEKLNLTNYPDFALLPKYRSSHVEFRHRPYGNPYDRTATAIRTQMYYSSLGRSFEAYFVPWDSPLPSHRLLPEIWAERLLDSPAKKSKKKAVTLDTVVVNRGSLTPIQIGVVSNRNNEKISISYSSPTKGLSISHVTDTVKTLNKGDIATFWAVVNSNASTPIGESYVTAHLYSSSGDERQIHLLIDVNDDSPSSDDLYIRQFISHIGSSPAPSKSFAQDLSTYMNAVDFNLPYVNIGRHSLKIDHSTGLISTIDCDGKRALDSPVMLVFSSSNGTRKLSVDQVSVRHVGESSVKWSGRATTHDMQVEVSVRVSPYGRVSIESNAHFLEDIDFKDITLEFDFSNYFYRKARPENPEQDDEGLWVAGDDMAICVSAPAVDDNAFYSLPHSGIKLYDSSGLAVVVGTGDFTAKSSTSINLLCHLQLLPITKPSTVENSRVRLLEDYRHSIPDDGSIVVIRNPYDVYDSGKAAHIRAIHAAGHKIMLWLDGHSLPSSSTLSRILESMGYKYEYIEGGAYMRFEKNNDLNPAFGYTQSLSCTKDYVSGVVFSPKWYRQADIDAYYHYRTLKNHNFLLIMHSKGVGINQFMTAPWADAIWNDSPIYNSDTKTLHQITRLPIWNSVE